MVWTGPRVRGAAIVAAPVMLSGKRFKAAPLKLPMGGSPFMMQIRGFQAAARGFHFAMLPKRTMESVHEAIKKIGMKIYKRAKDTCPVGETGNLKGTAEFTDKSKVVSGDRLHGRIQFIDIHITFGGGSQNVEYAVWVHEGHSAPNGSWVKGNPWLVRAARQYKRSLLRAAKYSAYRVWSHFVRQVNTSSHWVALGMGPNIAGTPAGFKGGRYGTGAGAGWTRLLGGSGPTVRGG